MFLAKQNSILRLYFRHWCCNTVLKTLNFLIDLRNNNAMIKTIVLALYKSKMAAEMANFMNKKLKN